MYLLIRILNINQWLRLLISSFVLENKDPFKIRFDKKYVYVKFRVQIKISTFDTN